MVRRRIERVLEQSLARMDDAERVRETLPKRSPDRVAVIAIGKAAPAMAAGALARWGGAIDRVLVVTNDGTDASAVEGDGRVTVLRARHPVPDGRSARAASRCLALARECAADGKGRLVLVLVSGGASALVCAPAPGIGLREKQALTRTMLASGASIQELNLVRKHVSQIKGGALARAARPARVMTLVTSDVIGGAIGEVGSGPATGDSSTIAQARRLLRRHAPRFAELPLVRTGPAPNVVREAIISSPEELASVAAAELRGLGLRVRVLAPSQAAAEELAREYVALAGRSKGVAFVRAAEPSVEIRSSSPGRGGRSTHLAALVGGRLPRGAIFAAAATDGVDGLSDTGGAIVDSSFARRAGAAAIARALERYDTGPLHRKVGTALPLRPSGKNLTDLHVLVVA